MLVHVSLVWEREGCCRLQDLGPGSGHEEKACKMCGGRVVDADLNLLCIIHVVMDSG